MSLLTTTVSYTDHKGKTSDVDFGDLLKNAEYTVLYFYPKDNTPGCTIEAREFSTHLTQFQKVDAQVIGVSKDSSKSHCGFQEKQELTIGLISDTDKALQGAFKAEGLKKFMGKEYIGTLRNTYLLDKSGKVLYKRENVTPLGHAKQVLEYIIDMK